jgi:hypothetical protein
MKPGLQTLHSVSEQIEQGGLQFFWHTKEPLVVWFKVNPLRQSVHYPLMHALQPGGHLTHLLFCNWNPSAQFRQILGSLGSHRPLQLERHFIHLPLGVNANPGKQLVHILLLVAEHSRHPLEHCCKH